MTPADVLREAGEILDKTSRAVVRAVIVRAGVRLPPTAIEDIRRAVSAGISAGIALGERYARWHRGSPPTRIEPRDEDVHDTRPGWKSRFPPKP